VPVLVHPTHWPLYIAAKTAAPQLIWGISCTVASTILSTLGGAHHSGEPRRDIVAPRVERGCQ
jgi:hypothetical protein